VIPAQQPVFLDTSIQIARILPSPMPATTIEARLANPSIAPLTSAYIWMEYQRTVVADYAHVYNVMGRYTDWSDLFTHILDGSHGFRPRSAVRCVQIIGQIYSASQHDYEVARYQIGSQIAHGLRRRFWHHVTPVSDAIVCDLVTKGVVRQQDQNYAVAASCRKEHAACHLPAFLTYHQPRLQTLLDYLIAHPHNVKEQPRLERLLQAVIREPRLALGQASCWPLGDVIIALQVPAGAALWTLDKDFAPLAQALDIPLYQLS
jgi:hypothetical protein